MTDVTLPGLGDGRDTVRVSLGWLRNRHECNAKGIAERCGGGCCRDANYWPPNIAPQSDGSCANLGPSGCVLGDDRPVVCHLYPLRHRVATDTIERHFRAGSPHGVCKGNAGNGPPLVVALEPNLRFLFGDDEYERLRELVLESTRVGSMTFRLAPGVRERLDADHVAEAAGVWPDYVAKEMACELRTTSTTTRGT